MGDRPRLDELRERLAKAGAPAAYVERLASELEDHVEDAIRTEVEAGKDADAARKVASERMGDVGEIVAEAVGRCGKPLFLPRLPGAALVALPLLLVPLCWAIFLVAALYGGEQVRAWVELDVRSGASLAYVRGVTWVAQYAVAPVVALLVYRVARRSSRGAGIAWGAAAVSAAAGSMLAVRLNVPRSPADVGTLVAGFSSHPDWARLAVTVAVIAAYAGVRARVEALPLYER